jgi:hypothetical protein
MSLDAAADKFASILRAATEGMEEGNKRRILTELLYHLGRWLYIVDACDDYIGDLQAGRWNAVAAAYPIEGRSDNHLPAETLRRLKTTVQHSNNLVCAAFELLPENAWVPTLTNMLYTAMPSICERVTESSGAGASGKHAPRKRVNSGLFMHDREWT